jgi:hypothetical protein
MHARGAAGPDAVCSRCRRKMGGVASLPSPRPPLHSPPSNPPSPAFGHGPHGHMMGTRRMRELVGFIKDGSIFDEFHKPIPKGKFYISDFPNPFTVLLLNLGAYYLITGQGIRMKGAR